MVKIIWAEDDPKETARNSAAGKGELSRRGFQDAEVIVISSASDAFATAVSDRPDVVITDLVFLDRKTKAGRQGEDIIELLLKTHPTIPVIVYSGHVDVRGHDLSRYPNVKAVVSKPRLTELFDTVALLLAPRLPAILHLSDIHFGTQHEHGTYSLETLRRALESELAAFIRPARPNVVVISGDLTSKGARDEFEAALEFVTWLRTELNLARDAVCFVPGNHDVQLSESTSHRNYWSDFVKEYAAGDADHLRSYVNAPARDGQVSQDNLVWIRSPLGVDAAFVGFASTHVTGDPQHRLPPFERGTLGDVAREQLSVAARALGSLPRRSVNVAILHHQLFPVPSRRRVELGGGSDASVVYGQPLLLDWLAENDVQLVLHGHTHYPSFRTVQTHFAGRSAYQPVAIHVAGAGTIGAASTAACAPFHHYFLLTMETAGPGELAMRVDSRILGMDRAGWSSEPDMSTQVSLRKR